MDIDKRIHDEQLKRLKIFFEAYASDESNENLNDPKKQAKRRLHKKNIKLLSPDIKKTKKINYLNKVNSKIFKSSVSTNNFNENNNFYKDSRYKSQDKIIKMNLVSRKFKIADDFNEKNSNKFLKEKDECLKKMTLSDKIEEESIYFYDKNAKNKLIRISTIKKNNINSNLNSKQIKKEIIEDDSIAFLGELIDKIK